MPIGDLLTLIVHPPFCPLFRLWWSREHCAALRLTHDRNAMDMSFDAGSSMPPRSAAGLHPWAPEPGVSSAKVPPPTLADTSEVA